MVRALTLTMVFALTCGFGGNGEASGPPGAGGSPGAGGAGGQGGTAQTDASAGSEAGDASVSGGGGGTAAGGGAGGSVDGGPFGPADVVEIPEAALTDDWCAPEASGPWEDTACCNGVPCKGLCYEGDAGLECRCQYFQGGCESQPGSICCNRKSECTTQDSCVFTH